MDADLSTTDQAIQMVFPAEIAKALVALQSEVQGMGKTAKNDHFKNAYTPLDEVMDTALPLLTKNKLALTSWPMTIGSEHFLRVVLLHESGANTQSDIKLLLVKQDPQGLGSAITYTRRQTVMAILGLSSKDDDDDGNKASNHQPAPSDEQIARIQALCLDLGYNKEDAAARIWTIKTSDHAIVAINKLEGIASQKARDLQAAARATSIEISAPAPEEEQDDGHKSIGARLQKLGLKDNATIREFIRTVTDKPFLKNCKPADLEKLSAAIDKVVSGKSKLPNEWYPADGEKVVSEEEEA